MCYHPMHMCGVWMVRKQNITDPKAKGIRLQLLENRHWGWSRREGAEIGGQQASGAQGSCKMLGWFLPRIMKDTKEILFDFS